ncbi:MAG: hypothetical protein Q8P57_00080 [Candidatus Pacearchaeota archaeon]|nr:hypothetical protein [Candidatus Pacearchaeota archaeon]
MENILRIFLGISILFFVLLGVKELFKDKLKKKFCVICLSVFLVWIFLLLLFWVGRFFDKTILALLIGMSSLGIFYLWEKNAKKKINVFRLPLLLTLILAGYSLIEGFSYITGGVIFIAVLWLLFFLIYYLGRNPKFNGFIKKLVECCRNF